MGIGIRKMLGRHASGVFWMFRYLERCENTARLLDAGFRIASSNFNRTSADWESALDTIGIKSLFFSKYEELSPNAVQNFIMRDKINPSSIFVSIENARENARMVRTVLTREVFEAVNETYLLLKELFRRPVTEKNFPNVLATIKRQIFFIRGALHGTMLRNDIYIFSRLGTYIERADNTARIMDVKYYVLLPAINFIGSSVDNAQWESILRSVSAYQSYKWLNEESINPRGICKYLILDERFPRSLLFCTRTLSSNIKNLVITYEREDKSADLIQKITKKLENGRIEQIFDKGLHEFISSFLSDIKRISSQIENDFRFND